MKKLFKRTLSLLTVAVILLTVGITGVTVNAQTQDPISSLVFSPCVGYTRVWDAKYPCEGDLVIPAYVGEFPVTQIWTGALNYTDITSVVIPSTVTSLTSGYNFDGCRKLKSAKISDNLSVIPNNTFSNCDVLESVNFGTGVTAIRCNAFLNCPKLEYIELPVSIKEIEGNAFYNNAFYLDGKGLQCAYYPGTIKQWNQVKVDDLTVLNAVLYVSKINKVASTTNGVRVTADKRAGAKTYTFYRQEKKNGKWTAWSKLKTVKINACTDTTAVKGRTYRYAVKATNGKFTTRLSVASGAITYLSISSVKLAKTVYTYNGKVKTPSVTVKNSAGKVLKKNTDYTVTYEKGRKNIGTYKVTVKFKGKYIGTKVLNFKINPPKATGFYKHKNGNSYYYKSGVKQTLTGLIKHGNYYYQVKNGARQYSTGLVKHGNYYYHVKNGVKQNTTGLVKHGNYYYYVKNGVRQYSTQFVKHGNYYYYVKNGVKQDYTGLVNNKIYVKNGVRQYFTGYVWTPNGSYRLVNGIAQ